MQTSWKTNNFQLPDFGRIFLGRNPSRLNCSQTFCYRWNCYIHPTININFTSYASFNTLLDFLLMNGHWQLGKGKTGTISILMSVSGAFLEEIFKVIAGPDFTNRICNKKFVKSISVKKEIKMTGTSSVGNGPVLKHHRLKSWSLPDTLYQYQCFPCTESVCSIIQYNIGFLHIYLKWDFFFVF